MQWFLKLSKNIKILTALGACIILLVLGIAVAYFLPNVVGAEYLKAEIPTRMAQQPKQFINLYGTEKARLNQSMAVTVDKKGIIYVSNAGSKEVLALNINGKVIFSIGGKQKQDNKLKYPYGLVITSYGNLLISDVIREEILEYTLQGKFVRIFVKKNNSFGIKRPGFLTIDKQKHIYVSDLQGHQVVVLDEQGKLIKKIGLNNTGARGLKFPQGIAVDSKGILWVADAGNKRIVAFDTDGKTVAEIKQSGNESFETLRGIAVDSLGRIVKADALTNTVSVLNAQGKELFKLEGTSSNDKGFSFPTGVFIDNKGKIYIADRGNNRIQIWGYPGE